VQDVTRYTLSPDFASTAAQVAQNALGLPNVTFVETRYTIFARYAVNKQVDLRFDAGRIVSKLEEWAWGFNGVPFTFSDNTTVALNPYQSVTYGMARFIYRF
jgi:hypothetical protein